MKQVKDKDKNVDKPLRLPQITSKTSTSFSTQTTNSRIRPSSSSKVNDLQKNLFTQLSQYDDLGKKTVKKSKTKKQIQGQINKQIAVDWVDLEAPYLKKIQKLMPQAYLKLLQTKKSQPLQQTNNKAKPKKQQKPQQIPPKTAKQTSQKIKKTSHKQQKVSEYADSFNFAEQQVQKIFQQYLQDEGLIFPTQIKSEDLKQLNQQINNTQADINKLKQDMYEMVQKFGGQCLSFKIQDQDKN